MATAVHSQKTAAAEGHTSTAPTKGDKAAAWRGPFKGPRDVIPHPSFPVPVLHILRRFSLGKMFLLLRKPKAAATGDSPTGPPPASLFTSSISRRGRQRHLQNPEPPGAAAAAAAAATLRIVRARPPHPGPGTPFPYSTHDPHILPGPCPIHPRPPGGAQLREGPSALGASGAAAAGGGRGRGDSSRGRPSPGRPLEGPTVP
uniref:Translation initiation factor IF-2-like isoform X2 n=1 Tax=Phascolarctos cinereus TaxID=38626 RepID=A0A6P5L830_PHACI|nr:translation initiation factor IF-2-like isoform X2 [Phascolarctos cinereus]